jgi:glycogen operon protein
MFDYVRRLIAFRKAHPVLRAENYDFSHNGTGYPELSFHGTRAWDLDEHSPGLSFAYMYAEDHARYGTERDAFIYIAVNAYWKAQRYTLPILPEGFRWRLAFETSDVSNDLDVERPLEDQSGIVLGPRTTAVLIAGMSAF